jgi:hypothetical protein
MRLPSLLAMLLLPVSAFAADAPQYRSRTLVITKTVVAATRVPYYGPYSCSPAQVRGGCFNLLNSSSHFGLFEGSASCVCSSPGR